MNIILIHDIFIFLILKKNLYKYDEYQKEGHLENSGWLSDKDRLNCVLNR